VVGEVPDIAPYIAESDVVLLPSDLPEGFGLVVVEAFAQGRPAIASRSGGTVDVITHGVDGWLFTPGDPASLAAVLSSLTPAAVAEAGARSSRAAARHTPDRFQRTIRSLILDELGLEQRAEQDQLDQLDQVELLSEAS
jgi:glycosyltransferase involved in cell wall biosynthesis